MLGYPSPDGAHSTIRGTANVRSLSIFVRSFVKHHALLIFTSCELYQTVSSIKHPPNIVSTSRGKWPKCYPWAAVKLRGAILSRFSLFEGPIKQLRGYNSWVDIVSYLQFFDCYMQKNTTRMCRICSIYSKYIAYHHDVPLYHNTE